MNDTTAQSEPNKSRLQTNKCASDRGKGSSFRFSPPRTHPATGIQVWYAVDKSRRVENIRTSECTPPSMCSMIRPPDRPAPAPARRRSRAAAHMNHEGKARCIINGNARLPLNANRAVAAPQQQQHGVLQLQLGLFLIRKCSDSVTLRYTTSRFHS